MLSVQISYRMNGHSWLRILHVIVVLRHIWGNREPVLQVVGMMKKWFCLYSIITIETKCYVVVFFSLSGDQTGEQRLPTSSRGFSPSHQLQQLLQRLLSCVPICMSRVWVRGIKQAICLMFVICTMRVYTGTATPHVQNVFVRVTHIVPSTVAVLVKLCVSICK